MTALLPVDVLEAAHNTSNDDKAVIVTYIANFILKCNISS